MAVAEPTVQTKQCEPIDLSGAHIPGMSLSHTDLTGSNFSRANLTEVNFQGSNLRDADMSASNLTQANLTGANLKRANLAYANLKSAILSGATLDDVDLSNANLSGALIEGLDLSKVKGLRWTGILDTQFDETTVLPDYLQEEELFELLESTYPSRRWRDEFSGRIKDLMAELAKFERRVNRSILTELAVLRVLEERQVVDERKRDE